MLVLTRRVGEKINVGDDIEFIIADIRMNQVKICISAPKEVPIYRNEIYQKIKMENSAKEDKPQIVIKPSKKIALTDSHETT